MVTGLPASGYRDTGCRIKNQLQGYLLQDAGNQCQRTDYLPDLRLSKIWNLKPAIETVACKPVNW